MLCSRQDLFLTDRGRLDPQRKIKEALRRGVREGMRAVAEERTEL
jgi:hypothetical protein